MNKGQFPESNKTISGIDLPKIDQDDDAGGVKSDGKLSLLELLWQDVLNISIIPAQGGLQIPPQIRNLFFGPK